MGMNWKTNTVDMHCDTISALAEEGASERGLFLRTNHKHVDLLRMKQSGYLLQNFALFVNMDRVQDPWEAVCALLKVYEEELAQNSDLIAPVLSYGDIAANTAGGRMSAMLTVEEGGVCKGDLTKLRILYEKGVRMLTLTWNYPNELGYPNFDARRMRGLEDMLEGREETQKGLTPMGITFLEEMEKMGMIVDVSHLSDGGFYQVLEHAGKPFVASHSNARAVCPCIRNLTDAMIRALGEKGGCMGLNYCEDFLLHPREAGKGSSLQAAVRHAKHIVAVGGIEVLGLGSDFDGIDTNGELPGAQAMPGLWEALHESGFTSGQLDKIFSENVLRVYRDTLN